FGKGISSAGCILDLGLEHNVVTKSGSFFSYGDERIGQGRANAKAHLDEHPEVMREIEAKVYEAMGLDRDLIKPIEDERPAVALRRTLGRGPPRARPLGHGAHRAPPARAGHRARAGRRLGRRGGGRRARLSRRPARSPVSLAAAGGARAQPGARAARAPRLRA